MIRDLLFILGASVAFAIIAWAAIMVPLAQWFPY